MATQSSEVKDLLKIGDLAALSGLSVKTIRYYDDLGLLKVAGRSQGNFRLFEPQALARLVFIRQLQSLGLSLQEIGECLAVYDRGELPCQDIKSKLESHIRQIDQQVAGLLALRQNLTEILADWNPAPTGGGRCPNLSNMMD